MMHHPKTLEWDRKMKELFDEIDDYLEDKYSGLYMLHPNRAQRGETSNKEHDGLFNVGSSFSAGYGSEYGRGYVVSVRLSTLENVDSKVMEGIISEVSRLIKEKLPQKFPGRDLKVDWDENVLKIHGDLSLGSL
jgi:hypothetical protein